MGAPNQRALLPSHTPNPLEGVSHPHLTCIQLQTSANGDGTENGGPGRNRESHTSVSAMTVGVGVGVGVDVAGVTAMKVVRCVKSGMAMDTERGQGYK